jgi:hypothetical protein
MMEGLSKSQPLLLLMNEIIDEKIMMKMNEKKSEMISEKMNEKKNEMIDDEMTENLLLYYPLRTQKAQLE